MNELNSNNIYSFANKIITDDINKIKLKDLNPGQIIIQITKEEVTQYKLIRTYNELYIFDVNYTDKRYSKKTNTYYTYNNSYCEKILDINGTYFSLSKKDYDDLNFMKKDYLEDQLKNINLNKKYFGCINSNIFLCYPLENLSILIFLNYDELNDLYLYPKFNIFLIDKINNKYMEIKLETKQEIIKKFLKTFKNDNIISKFYKDIYVPFNYKLIDILTCSNKYKKFNSLINKYKLDNLKNYLEPIYISNDNKIKGYSDITYGFVFEYNNKFIYFKNKNLSDIICSKEFKDLLNELTEKYNILIDKDYNLNIYNIKEIIELRTIIQYINYMNDIDIFLNVKQKDIRYEDEYGLIKYNYFMTKSYRKIKDIGKFKDIEESVYYIKCIEQETQILKNRYDIYSKLNKE